MASRPPLHPAAEASEQALPGEDRAAWVQSLSDDQPNFRAALEWTCRAGGSRRGASARRCAVAVLARPWGTRGRARLARARCRARAAEPSRLPRSRHSAGGARVRVRRPPRPRRSMLPRGSNSPAGSRTTRSWLAPQRARERPERRRPRGGRGAVRGGGGPRGACRRRPSGRRGHHQPRYLALPARRLGAGGRRVTTRGRANARSGTVRCSSSPRSIWARLDPSRSQTDEAAAAFTEALAFLRDLEDRESTPTASTASPTSWPSAGSTAETAALRGRGCRDAGDDRRLPAALRADLHERVLAGDATRLGTARPQRSRWRAGPLACGGARAGGRPRSPGRLEGSATLDGRHGRRADQDRGSRRGPSSGRRRRGACGARASCPACSTGGATRPRSSSPSASCAACSPARAGPRDPRHRDRRRARSRRSSRTTSRIR